MNSMHRIILSTLFLIADPYPVWGTEEFSLKDFRVDRDYIGVSITQWLINWADTCVPIVHPNYGIDPCLQSLLSRITKVFTMFDTIYFDISLLFAVAEISNVTKPYFVSVISRSFGHFNELMTKKNSGRKPNFIIQCSLKQDTCKFAALLAKNANTFAANTVSTIVVDAFSPPIQTTTEYVNLSIALNKVVDNESDSRSKTSLLINHCGTKVNPNLEMLLKDADEIALQIVAILPIEAEEDTAANKPIDLFEAMTKSIRSCEHITELKKLQMILYKIEYYSFNNDFRFDTWAYSWWLVGQYARKHQVQAIIMDYEDYTEVDFMSLYLEKRWDANKSVPYNVNYVYEPPSLSHWVYQDAAVMAVLIPVIVVLVFVPILLGVYKYYIKPLKSQQYLTVAEVNDFFKGLPIQALSDNPEWMKKKYTKSLEIKKSDFALDETNKLGEGEFGIVYRGSLRTSDCSECEVAFKTAKCSRNNIVGLFGLMSEIKILDYVGTHENVVTLLGAYTSKLSKGILYVAYEFCAIGSLHNYLEQINPNRRNQTFDLPFDPNNDYVMEIETGFNETQEEEQLNRGHTSELHKQLMKFSLEICIGMEYLAIKKIIHGDLAARNVLITSALQAKICDFGLSRRVYSYAEYVSKGELPVAWRWMAPETLSKKGVLSRKTDVWSYGVTLWEIFSFGAVPFLGYNCDTAFVERLEYGMICLPMPEKCDDSVYDVMLSCWKINPSARPNFTQLLEMLKSQ